MKVMEGILMSWINEKGPIKDVVLSSRIRLARNIARFPFPSIMQPQHAKEIVDRVKKSILDGDPVLSRDFTFMSMKEVPAIERQILVEKRLASQDLVQNSDASALILDSNERIAIMINEEDHIRMQCVLPGFQLDKAWDMLNRIDDVIEEKVEYAFHEQLGYLTSCPTNVGTGLRASAMLHLPALTITKQINGILQIISKIGLTARGLYGEGSEALGNIYQISNQITLGPTEEDIINNLTIACQQIIEKERMARKALLKVNGMQFEDALWRAYAVLAHARVLELKEFMALVSQVRLGVNLNIIPDISMEALDELVITGQPGGLLKNAGKSLDDEELNILRAEIMRKQIKEITKVN